MKELETIKTKLGELEAKKESLTAEIGELSQAIQDSFEDLLLGKVEEATIDQAKEKFEALSAELTKIEEYIQRAKAVRKQLAAEKFIPFAKENRQKRTAESQAKYDKQAEVVQEAIRNLLREQAKLGQIKNEVGGINLEYSQLLHDIGETVSFYDKAVLNERKVHSPNDYTKEADCIGVKVETQEAVYKSGIIPNWVGGDSIGNVGN